jgi:hypothetical protein
MSGRWVEVRDEPGTAMPFWRSPGFVVAGAFLFLVLLIVAGILITRDGGAETLDSVSIQELRGDPDAFDGRTVELIGVVEERYTIPVLDQYGLYEFNDGSGSMYVLSDSGVPPGDDQPVRLTAVFNGAAHLDDHIRRLVEDQFGSAAGFVVDQVLPGLPLNVVYLTHERYEPIDELEPSPENRYEQPVASG